jgi:hypothetical protein
MMGLLMAIQDVTILLALKNKLLKHINLSVIIRMNIFTWRQSEKSINKWGVFSSLQTI